MFFTVRHSKINDGTKAGDYDKKRWNYSFHPMAVTTDNLEGVIDSNKQILPKRQIANKKFPVQEISSFRLECFLRRAVNVMSPYYDGFNIDAHRYANDKFSGDINNFDKQPDMKFTGSSTKWDLQSQLKLKEPTGSLH